MIGVSNGLQRHAYNYFAKESLRHNVLRCVRNVIKPASNRQHQQVRLVLSSLTDFFNSASLFNAPRPPRRFSSNSEEIDSNSKNHKPFSTQWDTMFQLLKEYKARHGDTLVPATYPDNPSLGHWVDNNRQAYRMRLEFEESCVNGTGIEPRGKRRKFIMMMTDEKIAGMSSCFFFMIQTLNDILLLNKG